MYTISETGECLQLLCWLLQSRFFVDRVRYYLLLNGTKYSQLSLNDHCLKRPLPVSDYFVNNRFDSQSIRFFVLIFLLNDHLP